MRIEEFVSRLSEARPSGPGQWSALCPAHDDRNPSLSISTGDDGRVLVKCFSGCSAEQIVAALGLEMSDLFPDRPANRIVAEYDYRDENGAVLYQNVRYAPKTFRLRRPGDGGQWVWGAKGVRRVLYRLPELRDRQQVVLVEGEKDCDRLWSLSIPATTSVGGANSWRIEYAEQLRSAGVQKVVILPDNDDPGRGYAVNAEVALREVQIAVAILPLPGLSEGGDVSDWLDAGGTAEDLTAIIEEALQAPVESPRREVAMDDMDLAAHSEAAWNALLAANEPPNMLFLMGGRIAQILERDDTGPRAEVLDADRLNYHVARVTRWYRTSPKGDRVYRYPPAQVARDMLASPAPPLPVLRRVVEVPVLTATGIVRPDYNPDSGVYYVPSIDIPPIPDTPSPEQVAEARGLLLAMIEEFPFIGDAERANACAMLIEPFVRDMLDKTPLYLINKPTIGTGASLLASLPGALLLGNAAGIMTEGGDEDEWRKRVTSIVLSGKPIIVLDNLRRRLDSAALSGALTTGMWSDRILGASRIIECPVRCTWIATGNNPDISQEIMRRVVRIRLDAKIEQPWMRAFKRADLSGWVRENRTRLIAAILTLIQAWRADGSRRWVKRRMGFDAYTQIVGGILAISGISGFIENQLEFYAKSDPEGEEFKAFLRLWWERYGDTPQLASALIEFAVNLVIDSKAGEKGSRKRLGKLLANRLGTVYTWGNELTLELRDAGRDRSGTILWQLTRPAERLVA